ncbi:guanylate kinase [Paenibacillus psychroresistens]|uniref:guanylate kinase n=1 Tax=Paenibacillus psychroresistens TaxID=1778678 RepID=UPI0013912B7C|nr:guanylate kinase [Paenibacillus psychroresistens]
MGKIFVFYGPSAAGKSKIQKALTTEAFPRIITSTTRAQRVGEADRVDYIFMTADLFQEHLRNGDFVEWTLYHGEHYGTLKAEISKMHASDKQAHIILDLAGVVSLKQLFTNTVAIYIGADIDSIKRRLVERESSSEEVDWRLNKAITEELTATYTQHADLIFWNNDDMAFNETVRRVQEAIGIKGTFETHAE